jgi:hypothetical protein
VLVERSCRIGETRHSPADQLGELLLPASEHGEGPTVLVDARTQRVGGRLVRGGLPHEGTQPRLGKRFLPSRCLRIRPTSLPRWSALADSCQAVEPNAVAGWSTHARATASATVGGGSPVMEDHEGLVGGAAAGERDVDAARSGWSVEVEEGAVDGAALGGVTGLGVGQLNQNSPTKIDQAAPEPVPIDQIRRRRILDGLINEYHHAA